MKNILLTGASRGLGLEICKTLLERGFNVYTANRKKTEGLSELLSKYPNSLYFKEVDFSDPEEARKQIFSPDFIPNKIALSGFVNNAATAYDDIITNINLSSLERMFAVNTFAPMLLTKYAIRNIFYNKISGSIVHISSISVHTGYKGLAMYAASKGAIEAFSKNTAREWGERKVRSNCIVAGFMETDMSASLSDDQKKRIYNRTSLKSPTTLSSVANTVHFLLSEQSASITGQNYHVDAGTI